MKLVKTNNLQKENGSSLDGWLQPGLTEHHRVPGFALNRNYSIAVILLLQLIIEKINLSVNNQNLKSCHKFMHSRKVDEPKKVPDSGWQLRSFLTLTNVSSG